MDEITTWRAELNSADLLLRAAAAEKLCQAGSDASDAAVDLVQACADDEAVSKWLVAALEDLGTHPLTASGKDWSFV
ncbi:MAG: hypothetical protein NTY15_03180 [Planctomycetota bacterium]|nr:hypothetical protein [Planctomycetota bacterium]